MKITCGHCQVSKTVPDESTFIYVYGPKDENGLQHYYLYCRTCHFVTDFEPPGCFAFLTGNLRHRPVGVLDPREIYRECLSRGTPEQFGIFSPKLQDAMREDGVIP